VPHPVFPAFGRARPHAGSKTKPTSATWIALMAAELRPRGGPLRACRRRPQPDAQALKGAAGGAPGIVCPR